MRVTFRIGATKRDEPNARFECQRCSPTEDSFRVTLAGLNAGDEVQVMAVRVEGQLGVVSVPEGIADSEGTFSFDAWFRPPDQADFKKN